MTLPVGPTKRESIFHLNTFPAFLDSTWGHLLGFVAYTVFLLKDRRPEEPIRKSPAESSDERQRLVHNMRIFNY